jgi:hypothetical protein
VVGIDPLSDKYPSLSPYNYCAINPIMLVDPDGREIRALPDKKGSYDEYLLFISTSFSKGARRANDLYLIAKCSVIR